MYIKQCLLKLFLELVIMVNNEQAIREAAYYLWQNAGCPNGQDNYFWNEALKQLNCCNKSSCNKKSSSTSAKKSSSTSTKKSLSSKSKK